MTIGLNIIALRKRRSKPIDFYKFKVKLMLLYTHVFLNVMRRLFQPYKSLCILIWQKDHGMDGSRFFF